MQTCDILGAVAPYAALIITHLSVVSSRKRSIMIGEDVKNRIVVHKRTTPKRGACIIWNLVWLETILLG